MVKESNLKFKMGVHTRKMTIEIVFCLPMVNFIIYLIIVNRTVTRTFTAHAYLGLQNSL